MLALHSSPAIPKDSKVGGLAPYLRAMLNALPDAFLSVYIALLFAGEVFAFSAVQGLMILRRWAVERAGWTNRYAGKVGGWHRVNNMTNDIMDVEGRASVDLRTHSYHGK